MVIPLRKDEVNFLWCYSCLTAGIPLEETQLLGQCRQVGLGLLSHCLYIHIGVTPKAYRQLLSKAYVEVTVRDERMIVWSEQIRFLKN
jgi:hypothetical protein